MRIPQRRRERGLRFDITPLIDIVFNLVIFFLVATHFVSTEAREAVALPEASQTDERPPAPRHLIITVLPEGTLIVKGQPVSVEEVSDMIAADSAAGTEDYEVQIRGDRAAQFDAIEPLLIACARHGVTRVVVNKLDR
ncbi:MAG: biopolymer transporter ExbD [Planctomycetaceae bacterium]|nr:biopolymer transporter ExbD [Planctomycetaceae bacterium]